MILLLKCIQKTTIKEMTFEVGQKYRARIDNEGIHFLNKDYYTLPYRVEDFNDVFISAEDTLINVFPQVTKISHIQIRDLDNNIIFTQGGC